MTRPITPPKPHRVRQRILNAARTQIGVAYHKDAALPSVAFDCVQFCSWCYEQGFKYPFDFPLQGAIDGFSDNRLVLKLEEWGAKQVELKDAKPADVVLWTYHGTPHHTGLIWSTSPGMWVVHCSNAYGRVATHPLNGEWAEGRRFHSVWNLVDGLITRFSFPNNE